MHVVVLSSGGLDSTTLVYYLLKLGHVPHLLYIAYGQRHSKEEEFSRTVAANLGLGWTKVELGLVLESSALTNQELEIPSGNYTTESLKVTVVPNRNAIFANIAAAVAADHRAEAIALAVHAGDHPVYRDCRPEFIGGLKKFLSLSLDNPLDVMAPFVYIPKAAIVLLGDILNVPFDLTWSCYKGEELHCGTCSTCRDRMEAFAKAGVPDPTPYGIWKI